MFFIYLSLLLSNGDLDFRKIVLCFVIIRNQFIELGRKFFPCPSANNINRSTREATHLTKEFPLETIISGSLSPNSAFPFLLFSMFSNSFPLISLSVFTVISFISRSIYS